jgi:hypothetical protein
MSECKNVYNNANCKKCKPNFDNLKDWIKDAEKKHLPIGEYENKNAKRMVLLENIFNKKLIPELYDDDIAKYKNFRLIFEYPRYTIFPDNESNLHELGIYYERQQIDLLIQMALQLKVTRETIKHSSRAAVAAIMARNMSHNIGSHVLSAINDTYIAHNSKQVAQFHFYLQIRMDLLARIVGDKPDWGEPMFFVGDLLNEFFNQSLLLNHLISDQGTWKEDKIEFHVCLPNGKKHVFCYKEENIKKWICDDSIEDFLISIPDGLIGAQAFYVFLEGMIRNSAKYGSERLTNEKFIIMIDVEDKDEYFKLTICDNFSLCNGELVSSIQNKIKEDIVDPDGVLNTKDLGLAEMREACSFLIHPHGEDYPAFKDTSNKIYPLWAECPSNSDCPKAIETSSFQCSIPCDCNHLSYTFNINKPKIAGFVNYDGHLPKDAKRYGIEKINKEILLTKKGAFQFVIVYNVDNGILKFIEDNKHFIPQRILLVVKDNSKDQKTNFLEERTACCQKDEIYSDKTSEELIISVYGAWIKNKWLIDDCADFYIAFNRPEDDVVFNRWGQKIRETKVLKDKIYLNLVKTYFSNTRSYQYETKAKRTKTSGSSQDCKTILYDGHWYLSRTNEFQNKTIYFIHNTGSENKKIFETLSAPPEGDFAFDYFLLGLIEAALAKIIIVDERVADNSIEFIDNEPTCEHLDYLHDCLCYPVFLVDNNGITEKIKKKFNEVETDNDIKDFLKIPNIKKVDADFIIIHYGLVETHKDKLGDVEGLNEFAPSVVITTGRGPGTIKDESFKKLPSLEFSILRNNCYPTISKYHLVRALMSTKGGRRKNVQ